jgi:hypothetical protein
MSPAAASCEEKTRLQRDHLATKSDYGRAVRLLNEQSGTMKKPDYDTIRAYVEKAKGSVERTRMALDKHVAEHGC